MTSQSHYVQPPLIAVWLIRLFARAEEAESILGDLLEEFSSLASRSGVSTARKWYWRQTIKTVPRFAGFAFRTAPWVIVATLVGGFVLRIIVGRSLEYAAFPVIHRYGVFFEQHHSTLFLWFNVEHLITFLVTGLIVAFVAREREIVSTATLALIFAVLILAGSTYWAVRYGVEPNLWRVMCFLADLFVIVMAGAIVRMRRLHPKSRPSTV